MYVVIYLWQGERLRSEPLSLSAASMLCRVMKQDKWNAWVERLV